MQFNSRDVFDKSGPNGNGENRILREALNLYEITENLEEYYQQKAPNLWNAWVRTNNMLVEQQEKIDRLEKLLENQQQNQQQTQKLINNQLSALTKHILKIRENQEGKKIQNFVVVSKNNTPSR